MAFRATRALAPLILLGLPLGACATIIEGTDQPVGILTTPAGANCTLSREGKLIAQVSPTPGQVMVEKSKYDINIECTKEGYQRAQVIAKSTFTGTTFGNILLGGVVGAVVDASSGANNEYEESINIQMTPLGQPVPTPAPTPKPDDKKAVPTS